MDAGDVLGATVTDDMMQNIADTELCMFDSCKGILLVASNVLFHRDGEKAITPFIRELLLTKKLVCDICGG